MAEKTEKFGSVDKAERLKISWLGFAKRIKDFALPGVSPREPDWKDVEAAMKKAGKPAVFAIRFGNGKFIAEVSCAGTVLTVAALDTGKEKDRQKRRDLLKAISDRSTLVSNADLLEWDKSNPDPIKVERLKSERDNLKKAVQSIEKGISRPASWDQMKEGEREVAFKSWMRQKNYDRYVDFLIEQSNGREGKALYDEYLKDGAQRPIKVDDAVRKPIADAIAKNQKPNMAKAVAAVKAAVDKVIPTYNREGDARAKENLPKLKKALADKEKEYKDAGGR
jgi:hypothetical protein